MNREEDRVEELLREEVCREEGSPDPALEQRLRADPTLTKRLSEMRAARAELEAIGGDVEELREDAVAMRRDGDRAMVADALAVVCPWPARRAVAAALAAAAVLVVAAGWWLAGTNGEPPDGRLGGDSAVQVSQQEGVWLVEVRETLPPGTVYTLTLESSRGAALTATADGTQWQFPEAWNRTVAAAASARLVIEWSDLGGLVVRHVVPLK